MKIVAKVQTGSRKRRIEKTGQQEYKVWLKSSPEKGKANKELLKYLASYFSIGVCRIKIARGRKGQEKILVIQE